MVGGLPKIAFQNFGLGGLPFFFTFGRAATPGHARSLIVLGVVAQWATDQPPVGSCMWLHCEACMISPPRSRTKQSLSARFGGRETVFETCGPATGTDCGTTWASGKGIRKELLVTPICLKPFKGRSSEILRMLGDGCSSPRSAGPAPNLLLYGKTPHERAACLVYCTSQLTSIEGSGYSGPYWPVSVLF